MMFEANASTSWSNLHPCPRLHHHFHSGSSCPMQMHGQCRWALLEEGNARRGAGRGEAPGRAGREKGSGRAWPRPAPSRSEVRCVRPLRSGNAIQSTASRARAVANSLPPPLPHRGTRNVLLTKDRNFIKDCLDICMSTKLCPPPPLPPSACVRPAKTLPWSERSKLSAPDTQRGGGMRGGAGRGGGRERERG